MFELASYLNLKNGEKQEFHVQTRIEQYGNVNAVYVKGFSRHEFNAEFGVGIEFSIENVDSYMADYRHSEYWCRPEFGKSLSDIPDETQGLVYKKSDGLFGVILPVVSRQYKCVLRGIPDNKIVARLFSWYEHLNYCDCLAFVCSEGESPYELLEECTKTALKLLENGCRTREERRYPEIFEYLGWCSWDAMAICVNEEDLLRKCREFNDKKIPVKWAILDDMWAEVHSFYGIEYKNKAEQSRLREESKLYSFKADPIRFPGGLKRCIEEINKYGVQVGMWHPTTGYWMGIDPEGEIWRDYKDCIIRTADGRYIPSYEREKAYKFYSAFHDYLLKCGAAFVKIDNQSMTRRYYKNLAPVGEVARSFHNAIEASVGEHFDNAMINCMGMGSEDMWNRRVSPISRCSDDFLPEDSAWFTKHILQCSYNDLIQGQLYYCDWDMWWTDDGQAVKNSILRAISGGPIYVSDMLDRSNAEVIMPLVFSDGKILRCDKPAMPTADCITVNPVNSGEIFKLQHTANGSGILAVFNLDENGKSVKGSISPSDVYSLIGEKFAVYEYFSRKLTVLNYNDKLDVVLNNRSEFGLYIIVPLKSGFAPIGRIDKYIAPLSVKNVSGEKIELVEEGPYAYVKDEKLVIVE